MKEEILFALLKDKPVLSSKELKRKYPDCNINELRLKIINYQVLKYVNQIDTNIYITTKEEHVKASIRKRNNKRYHSYY